MSKNTILDEIKNNYSVHSGVFSAVSDRIKTQLNEYGQYSIANDLNTLSEGELNAMAAVSSMSNSALNESVLGEKLFGSIKNIQHDKVLGYFVDLYAGHVTEGNFRANASSGGIGTWLLTQLLEKKLIDGVIHVHPQTGSDGILFKYVISKTADEIQIGSKSRYYPVDLSEVLRTVKKTGGKYAITGIPSFITELRLLAEYDSDFKKAIAFTFGLVCGHQKSTKYAEALAWQHGIKPGDLKSIDFRKKVKGQPSSRYISEFTGLVDGELKTIVKDQDELFVSNWAHGFFKAKLSDYTDDAFNELADISLGDAWLPEYTSDSDGTNIVIVRNTTLATLLKEGLVAGKLKLDTLPAERIIKSQSGLVHHNQDEISYRLFKKDSQKLWRPIKRHAASNKLPIARKKVQDIREDIATQSHMKYEEAVKRGDWNYFVTEMKPLTNRYRLLYKYIAARRIGPKGILKKISKKIRR